MGRKSVKKKELTYTKVKKANGKVYFYWRKQYQGKKLDFATDPNAPDKGYAQAYIAWIAKRDQIDKKNATPAKPDSERFEEEIVDLSYLARCHHEDEDFIEEAYCNRRIAELRTMLIAHRDMGRDLFLGEGGEGNVDGEKGFADFAISQTEWEEYEERIAKLKAETPCNQFVNHQIKSFVDSKEAESNAGTLSLGRVNNLKESLNLFKEWFGPDRLVTEITGEVLLQFKTDLLNGKVTKEGTSKYYLRDVLDSVKQFVKWMYLSDIIKDAPKLVLIKSDLLKIKTNDPDKVNNTFTNQEVKKIFEKSNLRNRLYWLLMMNTSMTQIDIAKLRKSEFNDKERKIIRKRSKTRDKKVPTVAFKLWNETYNLLKKFADTDPKQELLLLNEKGNPIKRDRNKEDGKYTKTDSIASAWYRLKQETKIEKEVTTFRNSGATRIKNKFGHELSRLFLGQCKVGVAEVHYHGDEIVLDSSEQKELDEAIKWLYDSYEVKKLTVED